MTKQNQIIHRKMHLMIACNPKNHTRTMMALHKRDDCVYVAFYFAFSRISRLLYALHFQLSKAK